MIATQASITILDRTNKNLRWSPKIKWLYAIIAVNPKTYLCESGFIGIKGADGILRNQDEKKERGNNYIMAPQIYHKVYELFMKIK